MNKYIEKGLSELKFAIPEPYTSESLIVKIPKYKKKIQIEFELNKYYVIELSENILNPSQQTALEINWNNNTKPSNKYLRCIVTNIMGNMIKVDSIGYDTSTNEDIGTNWKGWLPTNLISIIKEL